MKNRNSDERLAYAARRASLAVNRVNMALSRIERDRAALWAIAWARRAGLVKELPAK
jgi:hypothetical protein